VFPSGGVDQRVFHPRDDRAQLRAKYRVPEDAFVIGYVSRVERLKGWRVFVAALELMGRDVPGRVGLLVGEGRESAELRAVAARNGDWLRYLGQRSQPQLSEVYGLMDAFVFPTLLRESLGLVALEAMSCGVPVIGSRIGALPEYIKDGWNGFLVEPGDARGIADAATRIFNGLIDRSIIARYAEATARAYGVDRVAETLLAAIGNRLETV
jgi:glycosyltransferase involved in cell wall biosynthesis